MASALAISIPMPGCMSMDRTTPSPAAIKVKKIIHLNVWNPIFPTSWPSPLPTAPATAVITSSTTDIWINRIKISPINFKFEAHGPIRDPKTIPPAVAIRICVVRDNPFFFPSIVSPFSFPFFFFLVLIPVLTFRFTFPCPVCLYFKAQSCLKQ